MRSVLCLAFAACAPACGTALAPTPAPARSDEAVAQAREAPPAAPRASVARRPRIVCLGDSLTAGYGLDDPSLAYPALIQQMLDSGGYDYEVVNAGVSGDTSAGALARLEWSLEGDVRVLVVALGGNDGMRGLAVSGLKKNLDAIVRRAQARDIRVVLAGMRVPTNMGPGYAAEFRQVYRDLARERGVALLPFLLEGVAADPALNQRDGIHPNAAGARIVAQNVWRALRPALDDKRRAQAQSAASAEAGP